MANKLPTYSSRNVTITWAGHTFLGLAPDSFIEIAPTSDITDEQVGADGSVAISILPDETGAVTVSLQQNSPTNHFLSEALNQQRISGDIASTEMTIKDPSGSVTAVIRDAHIKTKPTITRGSTATGQTMDWVFFAQDLLIQPVTPSNANAASLVADALAAAALIDDYLLS